MAVRKLGICKLNQQGISRELKLHFLALFGPMMKVNKKNITKVLDSPILDEDSEFMRVVMKSLPRKYQNYSWSTVSLRYALANYAACKR